MFNIAFFSSSDFTIPIVENILKNQGQKLSKTGFDQLKNLLSTKKNIIPKWITSLTEKDFNLPELDQEINLSFITSQPDRTNRKKVFSNPVVTFARKNNIQVYTPAQINSDLEEFQKLAKTLDLCLVASFGQILSDQILQIPKYGFINWHPSALPKHRGATPMQTALKNGDEETALSWINMTKEMDAGDIYLQIPKLIEQSDTIENLAEKMGILGSQTWALAVCLKILTNINPNQYESLVQNKNLVTLTKMLTKADANVLPKTQTAEEIDNHFRAYLNFPGTKFFCEYFGQKVKILEVEKVLTNDNFEQLQNVSEIVSKNPNNSFWLQLKNEKQTQTFLQCKSGYLQIKLIGLANGKQIDFQGFSFS